MPHLKIRKNSITNKYESENSNQVWQNSFSSASKGSILQVRIWRKYSTLQQKNPTQHWVFVDQSGKKKRVLKNAPFHRELSSHSDSRCPILLSKNSEEVCQIWFFIRRQSAASKKSEEVSQFVFRPEEVCRNQTIGGSMPNLIYIQREYATTNNLEEVWSAFSSSGSMSQLKNRKKYAKFDFPTEEVCHN